MILLLSRSNLNKCPNHFLEYLAKKEIREKISIVEQSDDYQSHKLMSLADKQ